ncbi:MAG TPA: DUF433 domain-containing protein [Longimicrobium sp.]|nr:DUF433 domain-containing protein [Longimicrobium sp.]
MSAKPRGIRLAATLEREIEEEAELRGQSFSAVSAELLREAVRMRRAPGIVFTDGPAGRRATIAGTGLDVWEVIARYRHLGGDAQKAREEFSWLSDLQFRAALSYYKLYPEEIEARLAREEQWTQEKVYERYPFLAPRGS